MTALRITTIAIVLCSAALAQASEITAFDVPESTRSREAVRAEALAAGRAGELRHDFIGRTVQPQSMPAKTRDEVREQAAARMMHERSADDWYAVGGM